MARGISKESADNILECYKQNVDMLISALESYEGQLEEENIQEIEDIKTHIEEIKRECTTLISSLEAVSFY